MHAWLIVGVILGAMPISPKLQAPFAQRICRYDAAYPGAGKARSYVIHDRDSPDPEARQMTELLRKAGFVVEAVAESVLDEKPGDVFMVFVMPGVNAEAVSEYCRRFSVLSFSGDPKPVRAGLLSIGLEQGVDGRAKIIIHAKSLSQERHRLSSRVVRLAEVIR